MALEIGSRLGHYDVTALIGEGGMGQVYQATDTKLNRQVALKILPEAFASDPDRLARFQREAQVLASLNHPGIAAIYGLEESDGARALVLELVEGPTLADRISQGPIPVDEALPIAKQIAEALEAAHEAGVIHRDLKPANIKVRQDGTVKVLDFGLAKALDTTPEGDPSQSPTLTAAATQMGVILGTAAYMSPEQARGLPVDKRADVWAFGVVLYEMLTGKRPFQGEDVSLTLASVMKSDVNVTVLPADLPETLRTVIRQCLQKDPKRRIRDVGDVSLAMEGAFETAVSAAAELGATPQVRVWQRPVTLVTALLASLMIGGAATWSFTRPAPPRVARFDVSPLDEIHISNFSRDVAVSPDGQHVAFVTGGTPGAGGEQIHLRALDQLTSTVLASESGVLNPFFSPDSQQVGYYQDGNPSGVLKRVAVQGGPASTIAELPSTLSGASWGADDTIVFGTYGPLWRVAAVGGEPEQLTTPDAEQGELDHSWPEILPGGEAVLFSMRKDPVEDSQIAVLSLTTGEQTIVVRGSHPRYVPTGHVVYGVDGNLWAVPFDLDRLEAVGDAVPVVEGVLTKGSGSASFDLATDGTLVYVVGQGFARAESSLVWVDHEGEETLTSVPPRQYADLSLSPDGTRAAVQIGFGADADVWVAELDRGTLVPLTSSPATDRNPVWSPDGNQIAFASNRAGSWEVLLRAPDGTGEATVLATFDDEVQEVVPWRWSPDGSTLLTTVQDATSHDIGTIPSDGSGTWEPLLQSENGEQQPAIAPNGQWIAYTSNESGDYEIYLQRYPELDDKRAVSIGGGTLPVWSPGGRELLYGRGGPPTAIMRVAVDPAEDDPSVLVFGAPEFLFEYIYRAHPFSKTYPLHPDGQRFLMIKPEGASSAGDTSGQIILVQNWFEELTRLVPTP